MTSRISLTTSWIQIATGASIVSVEGEAEIAIQAAAPAAGFAGHRLSSEDDPLDYAGALAVWARGVSPSSVAIVSGANVQPSVAPVVAVAPAVTTPPSMAPANPTAGDTVTISLGAASGVPTPKILDAQLVVGGERVAIDSPPVKMPGAGTWSLNVVWGNGVAPNAVGSASGTVAAPAPTAAPAAPAVSFTPANPAPGDVVTVALFSSAATGYTFSMPGVSVGGTGPFRTFTAPAGTYSWSATATNAAGISAASSGTLTVTTSGLPTVLTMSDFSRDRVVFDSGAAFGLSSAGVARSGTADPGEVVQLRVVTDAGVQVVGWTDAATADGAGNWTGMAFAPLGSAALRIEARLKRNTAVTASTINRFFAGHVIDVWGQSELHRSVLSGFTGASGVTIADPLALQVSFSDATNTAYGTALTHIFLDGSDPNFTGRLGALANMLAAERPGERFHLVMHTLSQTGLRDALDDSITPRAWSQETAIRDFALADGQHPGLAVQSWYNADSNAFSTSFGDVWLTAISQLNPNGTAHGRGTAMPGGFNADHYFSDWYDYAKTKWAMAGPHRFEQSGFDTTIQANRVGLTNAFTNPILSSRAVRVLEPLNYQNNPVDPSHPGTSDIDGMSRFMALVGYGILQGLGFAPSTPELDQWSYNGTTDVLTIGSSAGPITTTRIVRGGTLPSGRLVVDQVFRNGLLVAAADVSIVSGTIRVANVVDGDSVAVGLGSIGTAGLAAEDIPGALNDETWQDWPIVAGGLNWSGMEGLPVRGLAICPTGIIPAASLPPDPNGNPDLVSGTNFSAAVGAAAGQDGWSAPSSWTFGGAGKLSIGPVANITATGALPWTVRNLPTLLGGAAAELSFVITSPDAATGSINVTVSQQGGGGGSSLYSGAVTIAHNALVTLPLGVITATNTRFQVTFQRASGGTTGTLEIQRVTVKAV